MLEDLHYTLDRNRDPIWDNAAITPKGGAPDAVPLVWDETVDGDLPPVEDEDDDVAAAIQPPAPAQPLRRRNRPTVNLLGWRPARTLDKNQLSEIPDDVTHTRRTIPRYGYNPELFELALRRIKEVKRYKLVPLPVNRGGSVAQQLIWDPEQEHLGYLDRQSASQGAISSHTKIHARIATIAKVLCYRSIRRNVAVGEADTAPWASMLCTWP